jgi:hypothetical protein
MLALAGFLTVGAMLLVGSLFGSVGPDRFRHAPMCSPSQVFTSAYCRIAVDATVTAVTRREIVVDVDGRRVTAEMNFHGPLPGTAAGAPVRVTIYQGVPVHIEGGGLNHDTPGAPADRVGELRVAALLFLIGGPVLIGAGALRHSGRRAGSR